MLRISQDTAEIDRQRLYGWLNDAYWARTRPSAVIDRSLENSLCFSAWDGDEMIGFARVVTDYATFAWLCDVFVDKEHRGKGASRLLVQAAVEHPDLQTVRWMLGTRDAHGLYEKFGFEVTPDNGRFMTKNFPPRPPAN